MRGEKRMYGLGIELGLVGLVRKKEELFELFVSVFVEYCCVLGLIWCSVWFVVLLSAFYYFLTLFNTF